MIFLRSSSDWRKFLDLSGLGLELGHGDGVALLLNVDHLFQLGDSDLHLLDGSLAGGNRVGLNLLNLDTKCPDLVFKSLLGIVKLQKLGLLLPQETLKVSSISTSLVGTVISQLEFSGNVIVVPGDSGKVLFNLDLDLSDVGVGASELSNLLAEGSHLALVVLDNLDSVVVVDGDSLQLGLNLSKPLDGDVILLDRSSKLLLSIIIGRSQLHDFLGLSLGGHLELTVGLVGGIEGHLELGDGDGHLLLDGLNLNLQLGLGVSKSAGKNIDLLDQLPLGNLELLAGSSELLVKVSLQLGKLLLEGGDTVKSLLFSGIGILVGTGKLLAFVA